MENQRSHVWIPVLHSACAIPISTIVWYICITCSPFSPNCDNYFEEHLVASPWRRLPVVLIPLFMIFWGLKKKSLDITGAIVGFLVGFILTISNYAYLACLVSFFISSSKATKFRSHRKKKLEADFKEGGQRNWVQVLCNGGMATQLALIYLYDVGCGEQPIDFDKNYRSSWLSIGVLGAFACCNGDTWASEIGTVIGSGDPFLITSRKRVPRGTNGGVSCVGLLVSFFGGLFVGLFYYFTVLCTVDTAVLQVTAPQWPLILVGSIGGLVGSIIDSILGATLQYSGIDKNGVVVERPGEGVKYICGRQILDNHSVNLLSSVAIGLTLPMVANLLWP